MKSYLSFSIIVAFVFCGMYSFGQAQPKVAVGIKYKKLNLFGTDKYTIEAELINSTDMKYTLRIDEKDENKQEFITRLNLPGDFIKQFRTAMGALDATYKSTVRELSSLTGSDLEQEITNVAISVYSFYAGSNVMANSSVIPPDAGLLRVNREIEARDALGGSEARKFTKEARREFNAQYYWAETLNRYTLYPLTLTNSAEAVQVGIDAKDFTDKYKEVDGKYELKAKPAVDRVLYKVTTLGARSGKLSLRKIFRDAASDNVRALAQQKKDTMCAIVGKITEYTSTIKTQDDMIKDKSAKIAALQESFDRESLSIKGDYASIIGRMEDQIKLLGTDEMKSPTVLIDKFPVGTYPTSVNDLVIKFNNEYSREALLRLLSNQIPDLAANQKLDSAIRGESTNIPQQLKPKLDERKTVIDSIKKAAADGISKLTEAKNNISTDLKEPKEMPELAPDLASPNLVTAIGTLNNKIKTLLTQQAKIKDLKREMDGYTKVLQESTNMLRSKNLLLSRVKQSMINKEFNAQTFNLKIADAQFEFNEGYIKKIVVFGTFDSEVSCPVGSIKIRDSQPIKFVNESIIAFSASTDYEDLVEVKLKSMGKPDLRLAIRLGDLIGFYKEGVQVDRLDFSPGDQPLKVVFHGEEKFQDIELKKIATQKIFEARVFTDFLGLTDERSPNGIVQTEAEKRFNLRTYRSNRGWGFMEYLTLAGGFTKIDQNNKSLVIGNTDNFLAGRYFPTKYASTIDLRQHEVVNLGFDLNLIVCDVPYIKSVFKFDAGFRAARTSVADSIRTASSDGTIDTRDAPNIFGVTTARLFPKFTWEVFQDERVSVSATYTHTWYAALTNKFQQVADSEDFAFNGLSQGNSVKQYNTLQLLLTFKPQGKLEDKIFLRGTLYTQEDYFKTNFLQFQLGYSFFIVQRLGAD